MNHITTKEAAELIGITPNSVQVAILRGKLPAVKHGRDWLIQRVDAEDYAASERKPGPKPGKSRGKAD